MTKDPRPFEQPHEDAPQDSENLRKQAEDRLGREPAPEDLSDLSADDLERLVHELRVHQVELEVQNVELMQSQQNLAETRDRYRRLYDHAPVGYITLDANQRVVEANLTAADLLGSSRSQMVGRPLARYFADDTADVCYLHLLDSKQREEVSHAEFRVRLEAEERYLHVVTRPAMLDEDADGFWMTLTDVTDRKRAEQDLARERELLQRLIDTIPVMIAIYDPAMQAFTFNRQMRELTGWTEADAADGRFMERVYPDPAYRREVAEFMESLDPGWRDFQLTAKDGSLIDSSWANICLSDERTVGIGIDMRQRKAAEQALKSSEHRFRSVLTDAPIPVMLHTMDGRIVGLSDAFTDITGYTLEDIPTGEEWVRLAYGLEGERAADADRRLREQHLSVGRGFSRERAIRTKDGQLRIWAFRGSRLEPLADQPDMMVTMAVDISEEVWARDRITQLNRTLEQQVADRTGRLQSTVDKLQEEVSRRELAEQVMRERSQKLQELNNQLQQRTMQLQMLTLQLAHAEDSERRRIGEVLHDNLQQLLVAARFRMSTAATGREDDEALASLIEKVDELLNEGLRVCRNLSHELCPPALREQGLRAGLDWLVDKMRENHGLEVRTQLSEKAEPESQGLRALLYKAAQEMLLNVVKHADVTEAELTLVRENGRIALAVCDRGKGFARRKNGSDEPSGGMGLFGLRERLGLLGGRMDVDSAVGQGSTVRVVVPDQPKEADYQPTETVTATVAVQARENLAEPVEAAEAEPPSSGDAVTVLLVDDHSVVRHGMRMLLSQYADVKVIGEAGDGRQAVELAGRHHPDVVVMDVSLPKMNGVEATRRIKKAQPTTRVVGLSMFDSPSQAEQMRSAGADCFLPKADAAEHFLAAIRGTYVSEAQLPEA